MDRFIFADEAGCFTFRRGHNISRYFILCTIVLDDCAIGDDLNALRRQLAWEQEPVGDCFHATTDAQSIRDKVYNLIQQYSFPIQATIMEKSKAQEQVRKSRSRFYQYGWFYHFKFGIPPTIHAQKNTLITAASIGTKKERLSFRTTIDDVMRQTLMAPQWAIDFRPCSTDPCLQIADYCAWAIQRKWEKNDDRSYRLISSRITYEYDLWRRGTTHFY